MKTIKNLCFAALAVALLFQAPIMCAAPSGSAFTYQGRLNFSGSPSPNGLYDFIFALHSDATLPSPVGTPVTVTVSAVPVTNGLFTVPLDFGAAAFTSGEARWLQLQVNTNGLTPLVTLNPRQRLTPTPQAIYAGTAATAATASTVAAGAVTSAGLAPGSVGGPAIADGSITSADLNASLLNNTFWKLTGNDAAPGQFIGSTNNQPVEIRANNFRALRLEPRGVGNPPNLVGGYHQNIVNGGGSTIAGGGTSGAINQTDGDYGFIGAGIGGRAFEYAMVGAGAYNSALGTFSLVGAGIANTNRGESSAIVAGTNNTITALGNHAFIGGGRGNLSSGPYATVPGGSFNVAGGQSSFAAGNRAKANHNGSFVWADAQTADFASTATNQFLIRAKGGVGIGTTAPTRQLEVQGAGDAEIGLKSTDLNGRLWTLQSSGNGALGREQTFQIIDRTAGASRLLINSDGNVGIGTASPAALLDVAGNLGYSGHLTKLDVDEQPEAFVRSYDLWFGHSSRHGSQGRALVDLGNSLAVNYDRDWPGLYLFGQVVLDPSGQNANGTLSGGLLFGGDGSGEGINSKRGPGGNQYGLDFYTFFQPRMTIANNGNVGIGTTNPATKLEVNGTVSATSFSGQAGSPLMLGTTDNQPLEFKVNGTRALRLEPTGSNDTVNVIGGSARNSVGVGVVGATIGGGGAGDYFGVAYTNRVEADFSTVSGGRQNTIQPFAYSATIGGGQNNTIQTDAYEATIGGGHLNTIQTNAPSATIGGGFQNTIQSRAVSATIGGGNGNTIQTNARAATISGGFLNTVQTNASFATIAGGYLNKVPRDAEFTSIGGGRENAVQTNADYATIGGGYLNSAANMFATVPGGAGNTAGGQFSFAAGHDAKALHDGAFVWSDSPGGGFASTSSNQFLIRAAGGVAIGTNDPTGAALRVAGTIKADAFLGMGATLMLGTTDTNALEFKVNNQRAFRLESDPRGINAANIIGGYISNRIEQPGTGGSVIVGGGFPGGENIIRSDSSGAFIGAGSANVVGPSAPDAVVSGGLGNTIHTGAYSATIGGGEGNTIQTNAAYATIGGGYLNQATTNFATVPGGAGNTASGQFSFAAGHDAKALHAGAFVWADSPAGGFVSTADNQFLIRAAGGVGINTNNPNGAALAINGVVTATSATSEGFEVRGAAAGYALCDRTTTDTVGRWSMYVYGGVLKFYGDGANRMTLNALGDLTVNSLTESSDRNLKENFVAVKPREVLDKVAGLALSRWNFKGDAGTPHVGPMAQDFHAAFGLGKDDKHIANVDADGVALAAIQGLNQKVEEKDARIAELERRLEKLERLMTRENGGAK